MSDPFEALDRINADWDEIPGFLGQSPKFWQGLADFGCNIVAKEPPKFKFKALKKLADIPRDISEAAMVEIINGFLDEAIDEARARHKSSGPDWLAITREFG